MCVIITFTNLFNNIWENKGFYLIVFVNSYNLKGHFCNIKHYKSRVILYYSSSNINCHYIIMFFLRIFINI